MDTLTGFQRDLLYVIAGFDRPTGRTVQEELNVYYRDEVTHGRTYPNLDMLVAKDLVEKGPLDRRANYYVITTAGRARIRERREWEAQYVKF